MGQASSALSRTKELSQEDAVFLSKLISVCKTSDHVELRKTLGQRGLKTVKFLLCQADHKGCTPLHIAAQRNSPDVSAVLLEHGADPNIWTPQHGTPLHIAAASGYTAVVDVLLVHGACPFLCNANGKMAIELLLEGRPQSGAQSVGASDTLKSLSQIMEAGASAATLLKFCVPRPKAQSRKGQTPALIPTTWSALYCVLLPRRSLGRERNSGVVSFTTKRSLNTLSNPPSFVTSYYGTAAHSPTSTTAAPAATAAIAAVAAGSEALRQQLPGSRLAAASGGGHACGSGREGGEGASSHRQLSAASSRLSALLHGSMRASFGRRASTGNVGEHEAAGPLGKEDAKTGTPQMGWGGERMWWGQGQQLKGVAGAGEGVRAGSEAGPCYSELMELWLFHDPSSTSPLAKIQLSDVHLTLHNRSTPWCQGGTSHGDGRGPGGKAIDTGAGGDERGNSDGEEVDGPDVWTVLELGRGHPAISTALLAPPPPPRTPTPTPTPTPASGSADRTPRLGSFTSKIRGQSLWLAPSSNDPAAVASFRAFLDTAGLTVRDDTPSEDTSTTCSTTATASRCGTSVGGAASAVATTAATVVCEGTQDVGRDQQQPQPQLAGSAQLAGSMQPAGSTQAITTAEAEGDLASTTHAPPAAKEAIPGIDNKSMIAMVPAETHDGGAGVGGADSGVGGAAGSAGTSQPCSPKAAKSSMQMQPNTPAPIPNTPNSRGSTGSPGHSPASYSPCKTHTARSTPPASPFKAMASLNTAPTAAAASAPAAAQGSEPRGSSATPTTGNLALLSPTAVMDSTVERWGSTSSGRGLDQARLAHFCAQPLRMSIWLHTNRHMGHQPAHTTTTITSREVDGDALQGVSRQSSSIGEMTASMSLSTVLNEYASQGYIQELACYDEMEVGGVEGSLGACDRGHSLGTTPTHGLKWRAGAAGQPASINKTSMRTMSAHAATQLSGSQPRVGIVPGCDSLAGSPPSARFERMSVASVESAASARARGNLLTAASTALAAVFTAKVGAATASHAISGVDSTAATPTKSLPLQSARSIFGPPVQLQVAGYTPRHGPSPAGTAAVGSPAVAAAAAAVADTGPTRDPGVELTASPARRNGRPRPRTPASVLQAHMASAVAGPAGSGDTRFRGWEGMERAATLSMGQVKLWHALPADHDGPATMPVLWQGAGLGQGRVGVVQDARHVLTTWGSRAPRRQAVRSMVMHPLLRRAFSFSGMEGLGEEEEDATSSVHGESEAGAGTLQKGVAAAGDAATKDNGADGATDGGGAPSSGAQVPPAVCGEGVAPQTRVVPSVSGQSLTSHNISLRRVPKEVDIKGGPLQATVRRLHKCQSTVDLSLLVEAMCTVCHARQPQAGVARFSPCGGTVSLHRCVCAACAATLQAQLQAQPVHVADCYLVTDDRDEPVQVDSQFSMDLLL